jgi:hypothetical protein
MTISSPSVSVNKEISEMRHRLTRPTARHKRFLSLQKLLYLKAFGISCQYELQSQITFGVKFFSTFEVLPEFLYTLFTHKLTAALETYMVAWHYRNSSWHS